MDKEKYWGGLRNLFYIFGLMNLVFEIITFAEFNTLNSLPGGWLIAGGLIWLFFMLTMIFMILGSNLKNFPVPDIKK